MAAVLLALGLPLAAALASAQQQRLIVDRIDDTTRFASIAQFVTVRGTAPDAGASPIVQDGDVIAVVVTDSPTGAMRSRILHGWLLIAGSEFAATVVAVLAAIRLTRWVLRPVRVLDRASHDIATGRLASRVEEAGGPPELRRLARSFNEMAANVEQVLEQQRAFVADASHQLRNPLSALLL